MTQSPKPHPRGRSIALKIDAALLFLFVLMLVVSSLYQFTSQRAMVETMVRDQAGALADAYFDNVNTLMLTGKMAQRAPRLFPQTVR